MINLTDAEIKTVQNHGRGAEKQKACTPQVVTLPCNDQTSYFYTGEKLCVPKNSSGFRFIYHFKSQRRENIYIFIKVFYQEHLAFLIRNSSGEEGWWGRKPLISHV